MNDFAWIILWPAVQVALFLSAGAVVYLLARRFGPRLGASAALAALLLALLVTAAGFSATPAMVDVTHRCLRLLTNDRHRPAVRSRVRALRRSDEAIDRRECLHGQSSARIAGEIRDGRQVEPQRIGPPAGSCDLLGHGAEPVVDARGRFASGCTADARAIDARCGGGSAMSGPHETDPR